MTQKTTLDLIIKSIKQQYETPTLLQIKHFAKILKKHGNYEKINYALNDISKKLGYRKFADYKNTLDERGVVVEFIFYVVSKPTFEMPFYISIHCEIFLDTSYEDLIKSLENPYLVILKDSMYIQYSENKIFTLFSYSFNVVGVEGVFFNENGAKEFDESQIPKNIEDLYNILILNYQNHSEIINYDKGEDDTVLIELSHHVLLKPIDAKKQTYKAVVAICESFIDMDVMFGTFSSKSEAEYYSSSAKAYFIKGIEKNQIKIISRGKEFFVDDNSIVFKKIKDAKKKIMGKPLNPMESESFNIIKESLDKDSIYHKQYILEIHDMEIIDFSLNNLTINFNDHYSFQILYNGAIETKSKQKIEYSDFSESEIFFNRIKELFNNEKSLQHYTFEQLADDIHENEENHTKELNLTFLGLEVQEYERLINLVSKDSSQYKYNIKITPIDEHNYVSVCFEFCEQNYGEVPPNNFIYSNISKKYIYRKYTTKKDINNKDIRLGDKVKDSKGNTYLVDKYKDKDEFWLSCNEDLNIVYDLKDFNDSLEIIKNKTSCKMEDIAVKLMRNTFHVSLNTLLSEYILNIKDIKKNPKKFDSQLEKLHYCIEYIASVNFDVSDWQLSEIPVSYSYCFFNKKEKKSFDLAVYDKNDVTPRYLNDSFGEENAKSIEEAIEKYTKDA